MRHHGEALRAHTQDDHLIQALERNPSAAPLDERCRALVDYALKLTKSAKDVSADDVGRLKAAGLSDGGIHDAVAIVAYFNFVNRIALGLGVDIEDDFEKKDPSW